MYNAARSIDSTGPLCKINTKLNHSINLIFQSIKFTIPTCMIFQVTT